MSFTDQPIAYPFLSREQVEKVDKIVMTKMSTVNEWADLANTTAMTAINGIGSVPGGFSSISVPAVNITFPTEITFDPINDLLPNQTLVPTKVLSASPDTAGFSKTANIGYDGSDIVPNPDYATPANVGTRPTQYMPNISYNYPVADKEAVPKIGKLSVPNHPSILVEDAEDISFVNIPSFTPEEIKIFSETIPSTVESKKLVYNNVSNIEQVISEANVIIENVKATGGAMDSFIVHLQDKFFGAGDYVLESQNHIADRNARTRMSLLDVAARATRKVNKENSKLTAQFAGNNFSIPPGSLVKIINDNTIEASREIAENSSNIISKAAEETKSNFFANAKTLYLIEMLAVNMNIAAAQKCLKNEMILVKVHMETFNNIVELFNSQLKAISVYMSTFDPAINAALEQNQWIETAINANAKNIGINSSKLSMFKSQIDVIKSQASIKSQQSNASTLDSKRKTIELKGYVDQIKTVQANINSYKEAITAYSNSIKTSIADISDYSAEVEGSDSSTDVIETNTKAYISYVKGKILKGKKKNAYVDSQMDLLTANRNSYQAALAVNEAYLSAKSKLISSQTSLEESRIRAFESQVKQFDKYNKANTDRSNAKMSYSLAKSENDARTKSLLDQANAEVEDINSGALAQKARALSAMAQGAMSVLSVSARASGDGTSSSTYGSKVGYSSSWGGTTNLSEKTSTNIDA